MKVENPGPVGKPDVVSRLLPWRFAAMLGLIIVAAWPQVILGLQTFVYRDFGYFTYPVAQFQRDCFWRGELPLWNPLNCSGIPFLAQWNTAALYPPALFYLVLPLSWSLGVFQLLHLLLGGVGMFLLARRWTNCAFAAAFAGVVFAFNGLSQNCLVWVSNLAALMWMPWVLWVGERAWREGGRPLLLAALVATLQLLAGAPEIIALTWLLLALLLATEWRAAARGKFCGRFAALGLLVAGLSAVQLLPFLELLAQSHRDASYGGLKWALPPSGWVNFFAPLFRAHPAYHGVFLQEGQGWTPSYYVGGATLALAALAAFRRRLWPLAALVVLGGWLAMGDAGGLYAWLRAHVPGIGVMRYPIKFIVLPVFLLPLLAAFALAERGEAAAANKISRRWQLLWAAGVVALAGVLWWTWKFPQPGVPWADLWPNLLARLGFFTGIFAALIFAEQCHFPAARSGGKFLVLGLAAFDLLAHAPRPKSVNPDVYVLPRQRETVTLPAHGEGRALLAPAASEALQKSFIANPATDFVSRHWALVSNCNLLDGVAQVDGFFSLRLRDELQVSALLYGDVNRFPARLADFLGVTVATAATNSFDWQPRRSGLPLVTGGQRPVFADAATTLQAVGSATFEPQAEVYLSLAARAEVNFTNAAAVKILGTDFKAQRIVASVEAAGPALVVVAQADYPCWRAFVDGQRVSLLRANHAFQAVAVPAGRHEVELVYRGTRFAVGAGISLLTLVGCLVFWVRGRSYF